jgi:hypothetical protein
MGDARTRSLLVVVVLAAGGCTSIPSPTVRSLSPAPSSQPSAALLQSPTPAPVTASDAAACPRTLPSSTLPDTVDRGAFFGSSSSYGNGSLWVGGLWPDGIIVGDPRFVDLEGRVGMKFGWWRAVPGRLMISGFRTDAAAPPAIGDVPYGYGDTGFQASGVTFPSEGCWQITGTVGAASLTFTTFVIKTAVVPSPKAVSLRDVPFDAS